MNNKLLYQIRAAQNMKFLNFSHKINVCQIITSVYCFQRPQLIFLSNQDQKKYNILSHQNVVQRCNN